MSGRERQAWADFINGRKPNNLRDSTAAAGLNPESARQMDHRAAGRDVPGIKLPRKRSELEQILCGNLNVMSVRYVRQFHADNIGNDGLERGWQFDLAILPLQVRILVEVHGALGSGKHSRKEGQTNDLQKANAATEHGWSVLSYGASQIRDGSAALQIERLVRSRLRALGVGDRVGADGVKLAAVDQPTHEN